MLVTRYTFFIKENFLYENEPQKPENFTKMLKKHQPQIPELQFLKTLIFPRAL